jgi:virulence-associated protein VagC
VTLGRGDFSLFSHDAVIVRVPKDFRAGAVRVTVENRGANGFSAPAARTLELSERR